MSNKVNDVRAGIFNTKVWCNNHNRNCNLICKFPSCENRCLCKECIQNHPQNHLSNIVPLEENHTIPDLLANKLTNIKSNLLITKEKVEKTKNEKIVEIHQLFKDLNVLIFQKLEDFKKQSIEYVNKYYGVIIPKVFKNIYQVNLHYKNIDPFLNANNKIYSNLVMTDLFNLQEKLVDKIIPELTQNTYDIQEEFKKDVLNFKKHDFLNMIKKTLNKLFKLNYLAETVVGYNNVNENFFDREKRNDAMVSQSFPSLPINVNRQNRLKNLDLEYSPQKNSYYF